MRVPHHRLSGPAWYVGPPQPGTKGVGDNSSTGPPLYGKDQAGAVPLTFESPVQAGGGGMLGVDRGRGPLTQSQSLCVPRRAVGTPCCASLPAGWGGLRTCPLASRAPVSSAGCGSFSGSFLEYYAADISESMAFSSFCISSCRCPRPRGCRGCCPLPAVGSGQQAHSHHHRHVGASAMTPEC